jgi:hypothetical protein
VNENEFENKVPEIKNICSLIIDFGHQNEIIFYRLLQICELLDYSDESGRKELSTLLGIIITCDLYFSYIFILTFR